MSCAPGGEPDHIGFDTSAVDHLDLHCQHQFFPAAQNAAAVVAAAAAAAASRLHSKHRKSSKAEAEAEAAAEAAGEVKAASSLALRSEPVVDSLRLAQRKVAAEVVAWQPPAG